MQTDKYYFFYKHEFGQWTKRAIEDDRGRRYNCCEQYMMFWKAMLFHDFEIARRIMAEKDPRLQQLLGREVRGFNNALWDRNSERIVYSGNKLKFDQHIDLRIRLVGTYPLLLVEASPTDLIWGVGLAEDNPLILDERNWRGKNLLGKTLTRIRDGIIGI